MLHGRYFFKQDIFILPRSVYNIMAASTNISFKKIFEGQIIYSVRTENVKENVCMVKGEELGTHTTELMHVLNAAIFEILLIWFLYTISFLLHLK